MSLTSYRAAPSRDFLFFLYPANGDGHILANDGVVVKLILRKNAFF